jgi:hypothetical protein
METLLILVMILMGCLIAIFRKRFVRVMGTTRGTEYTGIRARVFEVGCVIVGIILVVFGLLWLIGVIPRS